MPFLFAPPAAERIVAVVRVPKRDDQPDRWDFVIEDTDDGTWLEELALNGWDPYNRSAGSASVSNGTRADAASDPRR